MTAGNCTAVLVDGGGHVDAVGDAVAVSDDEGRSVVGFRLDERLNHLAGVGERDLRHVDVAVGHGDHRQVLLGLGLAAGRELGDCAHRGRLGGLAAGV